MKAAPRWTTQEWTQETIQPSPNPKKEALEGGWDEGEVRGPNICCTLSSPLNPVSSFYRHFTIQILKGNFKSHAILLNLIFFLSPF